MTLAAAAAAAMALVALVALAGCKPFTMRDIRVDSPATWTKQESLVFWQVTIVDRTKSCYGAPVRFKMRRKAAWGLHFTTTIRKYFTAQGKWTLGQQADIYQGIVALRAKPDRYRIEAIQIRREYAKGGWLYYRTWLDMIVKPGRLIAVDGLQLTLRPRPNIPNKRYRPLLALFTNLTGWKATIAKAARRYPRLFERFRRKVLVTRLQDNSPRSLHRSRHRSKRPSHGPAWHRIACLKQRHRGSCIIAGAMYQKLGGAANMAEGRRLLARACALGDPRGCWIACKQKVAPSCNQAGIRYTNGRGVKRNKATAAWYFKQGCMLGSADSCNRLGLLFHRGTGVAKDKSRALSLFRRSCKLGRAAAGCHNLGYYHETGQAVARDPRVAAGLYRTACQKKYWASCYRLGRLHQVGLGVQQSREMAHRFHRLACNGGNKKGCAALSQPMANATPRPAAPRAGISQGLKGIPERIIPYGGGKVVRLSALNLSASGLSGSVQGRWGQRNQRKPGILVLYVRAGQRTLIAFLDSNRRMVITGRAGQSPKVLTGFSGSGYKRKGARISFKVPRSMGGMLGLLQSKQVSIFMLPGSINPRRIPGTAGPAFKAISNVLKAKR